MSDEFEKPASTRRELVARRADQPLVGLDPLRRPRGVVDAALTGWQADRKAQANRKLAEFERAQADYFRARGEVLDAVINTSRKAAQLNELPDILENDAAVRAAERAQRLAEAERASLDARHSREAVEVFKPINFALGEARKNAQRAEYVEIMPTEPASEVPEETVLERLEKATKAALELKNQKLADGEDVTDLDAKLQLALAALKQAGVEI